MHKRLLLKKMAHKNGVSRDAVILAVMIYASMNAGGNQ